MKPLLWCVVLMTIFTFSCKKKDKTLLVNRFIGKWDMVLVTGGIGGIHMTAKQFGHMKQYSFFGDSTCVTIYDSSMATTVYSTNIGAPYTYISGPRYLIFHNTGEKYLYAFTHDTLTLYPANLVDGFKEWYVRQE